MAQNLQAGFGHVGVHLVAHASGEEGHLEATSSARLVERAVAGVYGRFGQGMDVPVAQHEVEEGGADRALGVAALAEHQSLHGRSHAHGKVEELRMGQECAEDHLLYRM